LIKPKPIPLQDLLESEAREILSWPRYNQNRANERLNELEQLGVQAIYNTGPAQRERLRFLGKGHVGIVVKARYRQKPVALKIRRTDADRPDLHREAEYQKLANTVNVGPTLHNHSENMLVMELIQGTYIPKWIQDPEKSPEETRETLITLMDKAWRLDRIGLDHGELGKPKRHIIITQVTPRIIDFESASTHRRPSNLTNITHFLYLNPRTRAKLKETITIPKREKLIQALQKYKQNRTETNYRNLMKTTRLTNQE
jgi:putative serine/threonine protein kinase